MDGTLLNHEQRISERNKLAIETAIQQGVKVVVATGRSYPEAATVLKEANLSLPIICVNGAEIRNTAGEVVYSKGMKKERASFIAKELKKRDIYFEIYTNKGSFSENYQLGVDVIVDIFHTANPEIPEELIRKRAVERLEVGVFEEISDYETIFSSSEYDVYKFLVFSKQKEVLKEAYEVLVEIEDIAISSSGEENLEINSSDAQKGIALSHFVAEQGISLEDTLALGDNLNDVSMLSVVGYPVAMGNAHKDVLALCEYTTLTNREDGVGRAIESIVLKVHQ